MFKKVRVALGLGHLDRYTLFEWKRGVSVYFHVFNTVEQDRFHTHAFGGFAFVLKGGYTEEYIENGTVKTKYVGRGVRYIPRSYNHRLLKSEPNTISLLIAGPWADTWTEENDRYVRTLGWGRKEISRTYKESANG